MARTRTTHRVRVRRVYDPVRPDDGVRVLVDRLWPRGLAKEDAHIDEWPRSLTPSTELRRWFHAADAENEMVLREFRRRYEEELAAPEAAEALDHVRRLARKGPVTLLTAVKDPEHSQATVLQDLLGGR